MANGNGAQNGELKDLQSWPLLVSDVDMHGPLSGASATSGPLNAVVDRAIREILGWRPRRNDPNGFRAALRQSFARKRYAGRSEWTWQPHSYLVQTDNGAVTGAQASLYKMAGVAWAQSEPLLDGLRSLCDEECVADAEALRAIIRSDWTELVGEIGHAGGPRPQRVDALFTSLLGPTLITDPELVDGHFALLRTALGLEREFVNTIEDEQNLTNYLILVDYTISLRQSWIAMAVYLQRDPNGQVFLGTQTTLLNWELAVLGESAQQARYILDSMFIGDAERKTVRLQLNDGPYLTIDEVLQWTEHVALVEGPRLIREGGKAGIAALTPTLSAVSEMLDEVHVISTQPADNPLPAVHSPRAQRTFQELRAHAHQALTLAEQLGNQAPRYQLTLNVVGEGEASPVETGPYPLGTRIHIVVQAEEGWYFDRFEPDLEEDSIGPYIEITQDTTVTAFFEEYEYQLDVVTTTQHGSKVKVIAAGKPITAGGTFTRNAVVTLEAAENKAHEHFDGWYENGVLLDEAPVITVKMTAARQIEARFLLNDLTLTVSLGDADNTGRIVVHPGGAIVAGRSSQQFNLPSGEVQLAAVAAQGYQFSRWVLQVGAGKAREEFEGILIFPLTQDTKVEAYFAPIESAPASSKQAK